MKLTWTADIPEERRKEIERAFHSSGVLRERLAEILTDKVKNVRKAMRGVDRYKDASWPYFQADAIGYERALEEIISLVLSKNPD